MGLAWFAPCAQSVIRARGYARWVGGRSVTHTRLYTYGGDATASEPGPYQNKQHSAAYP